MRSKHVTGGKWQVVGGIALLTTFHLSLITIFSLATLFAAPAFAAPASLSPARAKTSEHTTPLPREQTAAQPGEAFGANLFNGQFSSQKRSGINADYMIQPGDAIAVSIWGAGEADANHTLTVDGQGKIFIPQVGPVYVKDTKQSELDAKVRAEVARYYNSSVEVYTSLQDSQQLGVFVSGGVVAPGRYGGDAGDGVLHYLDAARGIETKRGSFRVVDVMRGGQRIADLELDDPPTPLLPT